MALKLSNNADGLLALAISDSDTSLTLRAGHGSRFPALGSGDWFPITVVRASDPSQFEIMRCTARSGDALTVVRAQEGTSALTFDAGDVVSLRLTSGTLEENFPQVEGRNAKNLRFSIDSVGGKPELKFKSGDNEETVVRRSDLDQLGLGADSPLSSVVSPNDYPLGSFNSAELTESEAVSLGLPALGGGSSELRHWDVITFGRLGRTTQIATEVFGVGTTRCRTFVRVKHDATWYPWVEFYSTANIDKPISDAIGELKGKRMLFLEATAPPGWTQDTSINDRVLRIVNSAGGGLGGSWTISGLSASVSVGATTLSVSQMPSHSHTVSFETVNMTQGTAAVHPTLRRQGSNINVGTGATGGGGAHTHSASASISSNGTWRPAYVDVIACRKD